MRTLIIVKNVVLVVFAVLWIICFHFNVLVQAYAESSLEFNGTNSYVQVNDSSSLRIPTGLTLEAWINPSGISGHRHILGKGYYELSIEPLNSGFVVKFEFISGGTWRIISSTQLSLNEWYHIAGTYSGSTMRLFVNGSQVASKSTSGSITQSSNPFRIGAVKATTDFFKGKIDEVRVSDIVRYSSNFTKPQSPFVPDVNTRALWHFDEGSGTTASDSSGNNNTGTLVNSPVWTADNPFAPSDTTPPVISNVSVQTITNTSATIVWTTDENATSQVEYGISPSYGSTTPLDTNLVTTHSQTITGLLANTLYNFRVKSSDGGGSQAVSANFTFTTLSSKEASQGQWSQLISWPIVAVHAALLYTGEVLMWDGWETPTSYARLWNPTTQTFKTVAVNSGIFCSGHSMLEDGRLIVMGGFVSSGVGIKDVNIFNPFNKVWQRGPDMNFARWYPSVTTLGNGRPVVLSGTIDSSGWADTPEMYDPSTNSLSELPINTSDVHEEDYPLTFLLPNGKLFTIAVSNGKTYTIDTENNIWTNVGTTPVTYGSAAMYRPGKFIMSGGGTLGNSAQIRTALLDTTAGMTWRQISSMSYPRYMHNLVVLADGKVLAIGGSVSVYKGEETGTLEAELWDPDTESWITMAAMTDPRMYHSIALLLPDGRVLSAGGGRYGFVTSYPSAQLYSPPYLFKGSRPAIINAPSTITYGSSIVIETPDSDSIAKVSLIRLASVTHTLDMDQRYLDLGFTDGVNTMTIEAPHDVNSAPPGYYMLFLINSQGVPSVAKITKLGNETPSTTQTIIFDDLAGQNQVLNGEYPQGLINWGTSNTWWHSAPWQSFTTKSVTFNGSGKTSGSFSFFTPKTLVQLDAYNGGSQTTVTVSCTGQQSKQVTLSSKQLATIATGWTEACSPITISSTNGWDTNYDNFVIQ